MRLFQQALSESCGHYNDPIAFNCIHSERLNVSPAFVSTRRSSITNHKMPLALVHFHSVPETEA